MDADEIFAADAARAKVSRQPIRLRVQLGVGQRDAVHRKGCVLRRAIALLLAEARERDFRPAHDGSGGPGTQIAQVRVADERTRIVPRLGRHGERAQRLHLYEAAIDCACDAAMRLALKMTSRCRRSVKTSRLNSVFSV